MNYYLIDYENIGNDGLKNLSKLKTDDVIIIFYSENCKNINLDIINEMTKIKLQFSVSKVNVGTKNALDFQLSSYLGYLIGKNSPSSTYYIVSADKGFDCLCDYWKDSHISVKRIEFAKELPPSPIITSTTKPIEKSKNINEVSEVEILKYLNKNEPYKMILAIVNQFKTKQAIANGIAKNIKDSKKSGEIYRKLKPLLKEKNKH